MRESVSSDRKRGPSALKSVFKSTQTCILLIDFQPDFMQKHGKHGDGPLAVTNANQQYADKVHKFIAACRRLPNLYIVQSQDWHPWDHSSFASNNKTDPMTLIKKKDQKTGAVYEQMMWPDHCVQNTRGAELIIPTLPTEYVQQKGINKNVDSYSALCDAEGNQTGLTKHLKNKGITTVLCLGLAADYCVKFSADDAVKAGFVTYVVSDLVHPVDPSFNLAQEYKKIRVTPIKSTDCYAVMNPSSNSPSSATVATRSGRSPRTYTPKLADVLKDKRTVVCLIDFQPDFMEGGPLAVEGADYATYGKAVKTFISKCRAAGVKVTQSQDWHPKDHMSFAANNNAEAFSMKSMTHMSNKELYGQKYDQVMWPAHCVQKTKGAELIIPATGYELVQQKGMDKNVDSYSAFFDSSGVSTGFPQKLAERRVKNVIVAGLAADFCVFFSAQDSVRCGFNTFVVTDLVRAVAGESFDIVKEYTEKGVKCVTSKDCYAVLKK